MIELIYNHPFYLVGVVVTVAMFFVGRELYANHSDHDYHNDRFK